ncbi:major head protein [Arthrobacter phage KellEzio]|uniref:Major capsid protein n=1 Tax=Arthrobacter phage KellEzio TaxID=1796995 RepID=A0A140G6A9_9CAUD|nr:major head protein [Arthrobacter phage KellEzio]AMM44194.1 major capsid protein [Arthrobacter phage KellEzio]
MALWDLDEFTPGNLLPFVRQEPTPESFQAARWLPDDTTNDLSFEYIKGARQRTVMAHVMGFDSEAPIASRQAGGARVTGELPPIKRKSRIGEKELIRFLSPRAHSSDVQDAIDQVYRDFSDLTQAVHARVEWLRIKALSERTVIYNEAGVIFEFDFGLEDELYFDMVTKKDGTGATITQLGGDWADLENSTPISDLRFLSNLQRDRTGVRPREFVADAASLEMIYNSKEAHDLARGVNGLPGVLTTDEINSVFRRYELPTLTSYDVFVGSEQEDGSIVEERLLDQGKGFFVPGTQLGKTLWGPTAESRSLIGTNLSTQAPGIIGTAYGTEEPPAEWTKVAAVAFPTMPQAHLLTQVKLHA